MATVKVLLRTQKSNERGEAPLYLRIIKDRKPQFISLGFRLHPDDWNEATCKVKKSYPNSQRLNKYIAEKIAEAEGVALKMEETSESVSTKKIKQVILGNTDDSFIKYFEQYILRLEKNGKISTHNKATAVLSKLKVYLKNKDLLFNDITVSFLKRYDSYLRDELNNTNNTIHSNIKIIRKLINDAVAEAIIAFDKNPFLRYKLKWEKTTKSFLTEDELEKLETLPLTPGSMKFHHRNMYIFASYVGGMRISDVVTLMWHEFDSIKLTFDMQKSTSSETNIVSIKLPKKALQILEYYKQFKTSPNDFIFPVLKSQKDYSDPKVLFKAISSATAYTNTDLKDLAKMADIHKKLNFHTSRHTWATRALRKGMRLEYVSKLMGHTSIKTTQLYAKIVNQELDEAMGVFDS